MFCTKSKWSLVSVISRILFASVVLGQELDDGMNAKLVPQVSETRCFYDTDCLEQNSYCKGNEAAAKKSGFCACKEDHFIQTEGKQFQCFPFVDGVGSPCVVDRQCVTALGNNFAYCDDAEGCQCGDEYHFHSNRCYKTVAINDTCQSNYNCLINIYTLGSTISRTGFAHCVTGRCACGLNEHHMSESNTCVQTVAIGGKCRSDDECNINDEWGVCRVVCVCRNGWVVDDRGRSCLKAADEVGADCTQLSQCTEFLGSESLCDQSTGGGTCQCKGGAHRVGTKCFQRRHLGDKCTHRTQCLIGQENSILTSETPAVDCLEGVCQCVMGAEQQGSQCVSEEGANRNGVGCSYAGTFVVVVTAPIVLFLV